MPLATPLAPSWSVPSVRNSTSAACPSTFALVALARRLYLRPATLFPPALLKFVFAMAVSLPSLSRRLRSGRVRILWLVLGALLLVSALPIGLYLRQVLQLSQDKLVDTERVQQTDLTRSLAQEIELFESNLTQQLMSERQILALTGLIDNVEDPAVEPKVTTLLENFVDSNRNTFIYLTAVGKSGKGTSASQ